MVVAPSNLLGQLLGQLALGLDRAEDRLLALDQQPHFGQPVLDPPDLLFVQPPRLVLAVPGNEGDGVSLVQQFDRRLNLLDRQAEAPCHVLEIDG